MYDLFQLLFFNFITCFDINCFVFSVFSTMKTYRYVTTLTVFFTDLFRMCFTILLFWIIAEPLPVNSHVMVLGIQIDNMFLLALTAKVLLTGVTIKFTTFLALRAELNGDLRSNAPRVHIAREDIP